MSDDIAREFMEAVNERSRKGNTDRAHRWDILTYDGFPGTESSGSETTFDSGRLLDFRTLLQGLDSSELLPAARGPRCTDCGPPGCGPLPAGSVAASSRVGEGRHLPPRFQWSEGGRGAGKAGAGACAAGTPANGFDTRCAVAGARRAQCTSAAAPGVDPLARALHRGWVQRSRRTHRQARQQPPRRLGAPSRPCPKRRRGPWGERSRRALSVGSRPSPPANAHRQPRLPVQCGRWSWRRRLGSVHMRVRL